MTQDWRERPIAQALFWLLIATLLIMLPRMHTWWHGALNLAGLVLLWYLVWLLTRRIRNERGPFLG